MNPSVLPEAYRHPYDYAAPYQKSVAYFSMEFAVDQALKTYSGGLGFLAGSHMRAAYEEKQNLIGIGMLWKLGYYDQVRNNDNAMAVQFREKMYTFLQDTGITFPLTIQGQAVQIRAYFLPPQHFGTVPMFFLTTDTDGNDERARSISYRLYDSDPALKVAQCMVLGLGGAKLLDELGYEPDVYHFNEAHAVSAVFHLYQKWGRADRVRSRVVFTTHTPEEAGNEKHDFGFLEQMGFFAGLSVAQVRKLTGIGDSVFNHSLVALRLCRKANAVSKLHGEVSRRMWDDYSGVPEITHVTNAQNRRYWADPALEQARLAGDVEAISARKKQLKQALFKTVADQSGRLFDPNVLTLVWARRFAAYKRPDLLLADDDRLRRILSNERYPVQMIWAGKPYPFDFGAIDTFNRIFYRSHLHPNMAVLTGYELALSKLMKDGADLWLNTPIVTREASGTSGMTAAMNAGINVSTYDGWICEFAEHGTNAFIVPVAPPELHHEERDAHDREHLFRLLEEEIIPLYYERPADWQQLVLRSMNDVNAFFDAERMVREYYERVY